MPGIIHYRIYYHFAAHARRNTFYNTLFPIIGYAGSIITMIWGWALLAGNDVMADEFVAGHVISALV